jgi:hypothetical protein
MLSKLYFSVQGGTKEKEKRLGDDDDDDDDKLGLFLERLEPGSKAGIEPYLKSKKPKIAPLI